MFRLPLLIAAVIVIGIWVAPGQVGQAGAATSMVMANGVTLKFEPATVTIAPGDSVMWMGVAGHTVTSDSGNWTINASSDVTYTFPTAGTYTYHCTVHGPTMNGTVIVGADGAATSTPTATRTPSATATATATAVPSPSTLVALLTGANENPPTSSAGTASV